MLRFTNSLRPNTLFSQVISETKVIVPRVTVKSILNWVRKRNERAQQWRPSLWHTVLDNVAFGVKQSCCRLDRGSGGDFIPEIYSRVHCLSSMAHLLKGHINLCISVKAKILLLPSYPLTMKLWYHGSYHSPGVAVPVRSAFHQTLCRLICVSFRFKIVKPRPVTRRRSLLKTQKWHCVLTFYSGFRQASLRARGKSNTDLNMSHLRLRLQDWQIREQVCLATFYLHFLLNYQIIWWFNR